MLDNIAIAAKLILTEARTESKESHHLTRLPVEPNLFLKNEKIVS